MPNSLSTLSSHCEYYFSGAFSGVRNYRDRWVDRSAAAFYSELIVGGFAPNSHIDVLPRHRLICVCVPKCASTTIKMALSRLTSRRPGSFDELHKRRFSGLTSPARVGVGRFYRLATKQTKSGRQSGDFPCRFCTRAGSYRRRRSHASIELHSA